MQTQLFWSVNIKISINPIFKSLWERPLSGFEKTKNQMNQNQTKSGFKKKFFLFFFLQHIEGKEGRNVFLGKSALLFFLILLFKLKTVQLFLRHLNGLPSFFCFAAFMLCLQPISCWTAIFLSQNYVSGQHTTQMMHKFFTVIILPPPILNFVKTLYNNGAATSFTLCCRFLS